MNALERQEADCRHRCEQELLAYRQQREAAAAPLVALKEQLGRIEAALGPKLNPEAITTNFQRVLQQCAAVFNMASQAAKMSIECAKRLDRMERRQKLMGRLLGNFIRDYLLPGSAGGPLKHAAEDLLEALDD
jgi:hypothetical protein